jgi:hypothetical protein
VTANALPSVIGLFSDFREPDMRRARYRLFAGLPHVPPGTPISALPDDLRDDALLMSHFMDNLGVLVHHGFLSPELASGFLGTTALRAWTVLSSHIYAERESREEWPGGPDYQRYFEDLAETLRVVDRASVRKGLKRWQAAQHV